MDDGRTTGGDISRRTFMRASMAAGAAAWAGGTVATVASLAGAQAGPTATAVTFLGALCHTPIRMIAAKATAGQAGLKNFKLEMMADWDPIHEGLMSHKFHMAYGGIMEPLIKIDKGIPFVITLGGHKGCIMAAAQPEITSWKELKGKTVGVNFFGSNPYYVALYHLHQAGLDPKRGDVRIVTIAGPDLVPALRDRKIDAYVMWDPSVPLLKDLKIPHNILLDIGKDAPWNEHICCFMMSERSFVEKHPGTIKRLNQAFVTAAKWLHESPAHQREAIAINIKERFTPTALARTDFQYGMLSTYDYSVAGDRAVGERSLRLFSDMARQMGAIKMTADQMIAKAWRPYQDLPDTPL